MIIDLCARKIIGCLLADHLRADLVIDALAKAQHTHPLEKEAIFHSDRGSQYGSRKFRSLLTDLGMRQSMSAHANSYDNAWSESVIGTIKAEVLRGGRFADFDEARTELFDYLESYYNHHRKH